jgi:hypothetical protein
MLLIFLLLITALGGWRVAPTIADANPSTIAATITAAAPAAAAITAAIAATA